jgi:hypothetical protein
MLVKVKVRLPTLINVADCAALVVPTAWLPKVTVVELIEKPAVETGTTVVPPPPPQDVDHKTSAMQAVARITAVPQSRLNALISIPGNSLAHVSPKTGRVFVLPVLRQFPSEEHPVFRSVEAAKRDDRAAGWFAEAAFLFGRTPFASAVVHRPSVCGKNNKSDIC